MITENINKLDIIKSKRQTVQFEKYIYFNKKIVCRIYKKVL